MAVPRAIGTRVLEWQHFRRAQEMAAELRVAAIMAQRHPGPLSAFVRATIGFLSRRAADLPCDARTSALLNELFDCGLLMSERDLANRVLGARVHDERRTISSVCIITRDRPSELLRCIRSYGENAERHGRPVDFVVVDDSREEQIQRANFNGLRELSAQLRQRILYSSPAGRAAYTKRLAHESGEYELAQFALFATEGCAEAMGAIRNAVLLQTAGELILSVDDDTVCLPAHAPNQRSNANFADECDPTEFWFFEDRPAACAFANRIDLDVIAGHEHLLGADLPLAVRCASSSNPIDFSGACSHLVSSILADTGSIRLTFNGVYGDSGMYSGFGLLEHTEPGTRGRLLCSRVAYTTALTSREVFRSATATTITHGPPVIGAMFGLDNRNLLPPFFPILRNEDGVFGATLARCDEHGYFAHLPWAMAHFPGGRRQYYHYMATADSFRLTDFVAALILNCPAISRNSADRMQEIGQYLVKIGTMANSHFEDALQSTMLHRFSRQSPYLLGLIDKYSGTPDFWALDLSAWVERRCKALLSGSCIRAIDLPDGGNLEALRRVIRRFGALLNAWPHLVATARRLKADGVTLARDVNESSFEHEAW